MMLRLLTAILALLMASSIQAGVNSDTAGKGASTPEPSTVVATPTREISLTYPPSNPSTDQNTRKLLAAFQWAEANGKMIIGQHIHSYVHAVSGGGWQKYIEDLYLKTGEYPAYVGIDYNAGIYARERSPVGSVTHQYIKEFVAKGGAVEISVHMQNPTTGTSLYNGKEAQSDLPPLDDLSVLYSGNDALKKRFDAQLDRVIEGLKELQSWGIPVIFRPLHEMNATWFWWHDISASDDPVKYATKFIDLWRYVYKYVTSRGVNNLLWMWDTTGSPYQYPNTKLVYLFYPGDEYVDIAAINQYPKSLAESGLANHWNGVNGVPGFKSISKVKGFGEFGFKTTQNLVNMLDQAEAFDSLSFAMMWNNKSSIMDSSNPTAFMRDPRVITLRTLKEIMYSSDTDGK